MVQFLIFFIGPIIILSPNNPPQMYPHQVHISRKVCVLRPPRYTLVQPLYSQSVLGRLLKIRDALGCCKTFGELPVCQAASSVFKGHLGTVWVCPGYVLGKIEFILSRSLGCKQERQILGSMPEVVNGTQEYCMYSYLDTDL